MGMDPHSNSIGDRDAANRNRGCLAQATVAQQNLGGITLLGPTSPSHTIADSKGVTLIQSIRLTALLVSSSPYNRL